MKQLTCSDCQKEIDSRDTFHINYNDFINPITGEIEFIGNNLCLVCYQNRANYIQKVRIPME